jgi:hypothetical protein
MESVNETNTYKMVVTRGFESIIYREVLVSTLLHAIVYVFYTIC